MINGDAGKYANKRDEDDVDTVFQEGNNYRGVVYWCCM